MDEKPNQSVKDKDPIRNEPSIKISPSLRKTIAEKKQQLEEKSNKTVSQADMLLKGGGQYNPMPTEQQFTPPPPEAAALNTPLPTQPKMDNVPPVGVKPKISPTVKIVFLFVSLIIFALLIASLALYYTNYLIFEPPAPIKSLIEKVANLIPIDIRNY